MALSDTFTPREIRALKALKQRNPGISLQEASARLRAVQTARPDLFAEPERKEPRFKKFAETVSKPFEKAAELTFGATGRAVGGLVTTGVGEAARLAGREEVLGVPTEELIERGEEAVTPGNIAFTVLETWPGGGALTQTLKRLPGGARLASAISSTLGSLSGKLKTKAVKQFTEALAPTTKRTKAAAEKVVPELLEREVRGGLPTIQQRAQAGILKSKDEIEDVVETIAKNKVETRPILQRINDYKSKFIVDGVVVEPTAIKAADDIERAILELGDKVEAGSLISLRRIWDKTLAARKGAAAFTDDLTSFRLEARREATNAIRKELATESPALAKVNAEFHFWKNVDEVVEETLKRKAPQSGKLRERIGAGTGAVVGVKGGVIGSLVGTFLGSKLTQVFNSAAWKTTSAVFKNNLADDLVNGRINKVIEFLRRLGIVTRNEIQQIREETR